MNKMMVHLPLGSEHRWGERVRVDLPVEVLEEGRAEVDGHLKNISLSGALLQSGVDLHLHALIAVRIAPPRHPRLLCGQGAGVPQAVARCRHRMVRVRASVVKDLLRLPSGRYPL